MLTLTKTLFGVMLSTVWKLNDFLLCISWSRCHGSLCVAVSELSRPLYATCCRLCNTVNAGSSKQRFVPIVSVAVFWNTVYVDAAWEYSMLCLSVCHLVGRSVTILSRGKTADAVWNVDSGRLKEPCIRWRSRSFMRRGNFDRENVIRTANGWLKEQDYRYLYNWIRVLENSRTKLISVAGNYIEKLQNMMYISCD